jgi:hypothetical protein
VILQCRFFLFTVNRDNGIARESFSFKIILRSPWYNHLSSNVSMIIIYCGLLDDNVPPSQLDLSIVQSFLLPNWSHPPILVDTISRGVTMVKTYFEQCTLGFIFFKSVIIIIYFPWNVISKKKYCSWTVNVAINIYGDMLLFDNSVLKMYLLNTQLNFHKRSNLFSKWLYVMGM